ncbi:MAG: ComF family protein [Bacteroidota bacterium]
MQKVLTDLLDLVFPNCCPGCGQPFVTGEEYLCTGCELDLPSFLPDEDIKDRFVGRIEVTDARSFLKFYHGGLVQKIMHNIKYRSDQELGEFMGRMLINHFSADKAFRDIDVIIPIPLHKSRLKSRGYNQSDTLARGMAEALGVIVDTQSVARVKKSETQTRKSRAERWNNVSGIFQVSGEALTEKNVLLIDDVITTGATLEACGEAILSSGAKSISIAALAAAM